MLREHLLAAIGSLKTARLRSFLTSLGVVIGVSSIVLVGALSDAAKKSVSASMEGIGPKTVIVTPNDRAGASSAVLTERDARELSARISGVRDAAFSVTGGARIRRYGVEGDGTLIGVSENFFPPAALTVVSGRTLSNDELRRSTTSVVLTESFARRLFPRNDFLEGDVVTINGTVGRVVGIVRAPGLGGIPGGGSDVAIVSAGAARQRFGLFNRSAADGVGSIIIRVDNSSDLVTVADETKSILNTLKNPGGRRSDPVSVTTSAELSKATDSVTFAVQAVLAIIASISLVVGAIGIANIMLVTVAERTREIGIRIAIGAHPDQIRDQFLVEAGLLCLIGGTAGVILPVFVLFVANHVLDLGARVSIDQALIALCLSISVGLVAGFVPARRASRMSPVRALRSE